MKKPVIVMLCYARSGGTLLNKCLASLPNIIMMSEVNPLGGGWGAAGNKSFTTIKEQALHWYNINLVSEGFSDNVEELNNYCCKEGKTLILRDWSYVNFSGHAYNNNTPPNSFLILDSLKDKCEVFSFAFLRDAIDVCLSRKINVDKFASSYLAYANKVKKLKIPIFYYEDLCKEPDLFMKNICYKLGIDFDKNYIKNYHHITNVNGDTQHSHRKISYPTILSLPRRNANSNVIRDINNSSKIKEANKLFNYKEEF